MQNKDEFTLEAINKENTEQTNCSAGVNISEKLLEQLLIALKPKPFRKRHPIIFWGGIILLVFILFSSLMPEDSAHIFADNRIAVVRIKGVITDSKPTLDWIDEISKDESVQGVLLRIDSPGGGAAASQEIYSALKTLSGKKPMVVSMGSAAASGGLMIAMAAKQIVANPSTVTGSIGVRMDLPQIYDVLEKIGIDQLTIKTGTFKDTGSPTRPMTEEERVYLEGVLNDMYEQFVQMIAEGRNMPVENVRKIADGRIFTGRAAKELGLVDELGGQDVALKILYKQTNVDPETPLLEEPDLKALWQSFGESLGLDFNKSLSTPKFLYQY